MANVADSQHQHSHSTSHHKHRLKEEFEELEAENERLKAIFDLHSISYNEQSSSKSRRNSDPEPGGKNSSVSEVFLGDNRRQTKRSSMSSESSEGRSSTKYEDVKVKVSPDFKKLVIGGKKMLTTSTIQSLRSVCLDALVLIELNSVSVSCSVEKMQRSVILSTLNIGMECGKYFVFVPN